MTRPLLALVALALLASGPGLFLAAGEARAAASYQSATLPFATPPLAFWDARPGYADGRHAYVLPMGLCDGGCPAIAGYDPDADALVPVKATLPASLSGAAIAWDGKHAYIIGGVKDGAYSAEIFRFTPSTGEVMAMNARLPNPLAANAAVWSPFARPEIGCPNGCAFIFGGIGTGDRGSDRILRYDPATDQVTTMRTRLPEVRIGGSAIWNGEYAFILGGDTQGTGAGRAIYRYDPVRDEIRTMNAELPTSRRDMASAWSGLDAYLFGGLDSGRASAEILRYSTKTDTLERLDEVLPTRLYTAAAVWAGDAAYVFGGTNGDGYGSNDILKFTPTTARARPVFPSGVQVTYAGPSPVYVPPGETRAFDFTITNDEPTTLDLTVSFQSGGPASWRSEARPQKLHLPAGGSSVVRATLTAPADYRPAPGGTLFEAFLRVESPLLSGGGQGSVEVTDVPERAGRTLTPPPQVITQPTQPAFPVGVAYVGGDPLTIPVGTSGELRFQLKHAGSEPYVLSSYLGSIDGPAFTTRTDPSALYLTPGQAADVRAWINIPGDAEIGETYTARFVVSNMSAGSTSVEVQFTVVGIAAVSDVPLPAIEPAPGVEADVPLTVWAQAAAAIAEHKLAAAGVTASASLAAVGAALTARREAWRWGALAPAVGLFTRLSKPQVMGHTVRERIYQAIREKPGITYTELKTRFTLNTGTLIYHLRTLEQHKFVTSRREGIYRRFYPLGERVPEAPQHAITPMQERILNLLAEGPLTQGEIAARLEVTKQGANYHVKTLVRKGLIAFERRSDGWVCVRTEPAAGTPPTGADEAHTPR